MFVGSHLSSPAGPYVLLAALPPTTLLSQFPLVGSFPIASIYLGWAQSCYPEWFHHWSLQPRWLSVGLQSFNSSRRNMHSYQYVARCVTTTVPIAQWSWLTSLHEQGTDSIFTAVFPLGWKSAEQCLDACLHDYLLPLLWQVHPTTQQSTTVTCCRALQHCMDYTWAKSPSTPGSGKLPVLLHFGEKDTWAPCVLNPRSLLTATLYSHTWFPKRLIQPCLA